MPDPMDGFKNPARPQRMMHSGALDAVSEEPRPPIYARWEGREFPVRWSPYRPEPGPGDIVRLDVDGGRLWRSFRVVARFDRPSTTGGSSRMAIDLDVVPAPDAG